MNTEITDKEKVKGWVLYDADCRLCTAMSGRFRALLATRRFQLLPLQTPWVIAQLGMPDSQRLSEMRLLKPDGKLFGGVDALREISHHFWWSWPFSQATRAPLVMNLLRMGYLWIARNRNCVDGVCAIKTPPIKCQNRLADFLPLLVLPLLSLLLRTQVASSVFMWTLAFALYAGCKWLTYREATRRGGAQDLQRSMEYLLAWPGMDAVNFLDPKNQPTKPLRREWIFALAKTAIGLVLLYGIARMAFPAHPLLAGWLGMIGVIFVLHFGLFHILALAWRHVGVQVEPVMSAPILANSLADFWGKRWNTAFNELAFRFTYRPIRRLTTPGAATLLVFTLSGLIHDLLISLPARGGYGLPTAYFFVQGLGMITERSQWGRRMGLGHGKRGWLFTVIVTVGPAFWLFHPAFIKNVILPMLAAIGAT